MEKVGLNKLRYNRLLHLKKMTIFFILLFSLSQFIISVSIETHWLLISTIDVCLVFMLYQWDLQLKRWKLQIEKPTDIIRNTLFNYKLNKYYWLVLPVSLSAYLTSSSIKVGSMFALGLNLQFLAIILLQNLAIFMQRFSPLKLGFILPLFTSILAGSVYIQTKIEWIIHINPFVGGLNSLFFYLSRI